MNYSNFYRGAQVCGGAGSTLTGLLGLAGYVLLSLGLMTLAKRKNIENPWLAWIPIANLYILGKIISRVKIGSFELERLELWLPLSVLVPAVLGWLPVINILVFIALAIFYGFVIYRLFTIYRKEQAALFTILSIVFALIGVFGLLVFIIRDDTESI